LETRVRVRDECSLCHLQLELIIHGVNVIPVMVKASNLSLGPSGDKYTGFGQFGQIVDQRWMQSTGGSPANLDRTTYGYDLAGNRP